MTTHARLSALPEFDHPPVGEVALSVQFNRLSALQIPHFGMLWTSLKERFPQTQSHPPVPAAFEQFGEGVIAPQEIRLELMNELMPARVWFISPSGNEIMQIQHDRFSFNWRKLSETDIYPRYGHIRQRFLDEFHNLSQFLDNEKLGEIVANQCEVTYINHIGSGSAWEKHSELGEVLAPWRSDYSHQSLPECESIQLTCRYLIENEEDGKKIPVGRLHVNLQPARRVSDNTPIFAMNLTARGKPLSDGIEGAMKFIDLGHERIVQGFTALTTERMHKEWGLHA